MARLRARASWADLGALLLLGAVLRLPTLGDQSFWLDETVTARLVRMSFAGMLRAIPRSESTPPLYYAVAWPWSRLFGHSEPGLRSLSALFGLLTILVAYRIGARGGRRVAVAFAALVAVSPFMVWYSQESRSYAMLVLLTGCSIVAFLRVRERRSLGRAFSWALVSAAALATHYFALFVVLPLAAVVLVSLRHDRRSLLALSPLVLVAFALLPLALHQRANASAAFIANGSLTTRLVQVPKQLLVGYDLPNQVVITVLAAVLAVVLARRALFGGDTREQGLARAALGLGAVALVLPLLLTAAGEDYFLTRNLIGAWLPLAAVVAIGAASQTSGRLEHVSFAGLCLLAVAAVVLVDGNRRYQRDDWRGAGRAIDRDRVDRRLVILTPASGATALEYYLQSSATLNRPTADVSELDLLSLGTRSAGVAVSAPRPATPAAPPGFAAVARVDGTTWTLVRYRSRNGARIRLAPPVSLTGKRAAAVVAGR